MEELGDEVEAYERLNAGRSEGVVLEGVEDLPKALIRARIAAGMTQESLARRLGVKPQQVQRYVGDGVWERQLYQDSESSAGPSGWEYA